MRLLACALMAAALLPTIAIAEDPVDTQLALARARVSACIAISRASGSPVCNSTECQLATNRAEAAIEAAKQRTPKKLPAGECEVSQLEELLGPAALASDCCGPNCNCAARQAAAKVKVPPPPPVKAAPSFPDFPPGAKPGDVFTLENGRWVPDTSGAYVSGPDGVRITQTRTPVVSRPTASRAISSPVSTPVFSNCPNGVCPNVRR